MVPRGPRASRPHTGVPNHMEQPQRTPSLDLDLTSLNRWLDQSSAAPARGSPPDDAPESPLRSSRPAAPLFVMRTSDGADAWRHKQSATPAEETGAWRHKQPVPRAPPSTPKPFVVPTAEIAAALRSKDEQLAALQTTAAALATQLRGAESRVMILEARVGGAEHGARQLQVGLDQVGFESSSIVYMYDEFFP